MAKTLGSQETMSSRRKTKAVGHKPPPSIDQACRKVSYGSFDTHFKRGDQLGDGNYSTVFVGVHDSSSREYAIKHIDLDQMSKVKVIDVQDEIDILKMVREGPAIVPLFEYYEKGPEFFFVTELCGGGDLFEQINESDIFTEKDARDCCGCILEGLDYMHAMRIAHRDICPQNLLLGEIDDYTTLKIGDFGFARKVKQQFGLRTLCGTAEYMAPEILERWPAYDTPCDVWSAGVVVFLLLGGYLPFEDEAGDVDGMFERARNGEYYFYPEYWSKITQAGKDVVTAMLTLNPKKRITALEAKKCDWFTKYGDRDLKKIRVNINNLKESMEDCMRRSMKENMSLKPGTRKVKLKDHFTKFLEKKGNRGDGERIKKTQKKDREKETPNDHGKIIEDSATGMKFDHFYDVGEMLGEGGYACVFQANHKTRGGSYAIKDVDLTMLEAGGDATLQDEIWALKLLRGGPHIVRLYDVFEEPEHVYLVMEEMKGGDLLNRIGEKEVYTEREARKTCKIIYEAMDYIHRKKIAHRDMKPENVLLVEEGDDTTIKIADFGFAKKVPKPNCLRTLCGTAQYVAPEVLELKETGYDQRADMWSVGVVAYILLGGYAPFEGPVDLLAKAIISGDYEFHDKYWADISEDAKDMISSLLQVDPEIRLSAEEALQTQWMRLEEETLNAKDLSRAKEQIQTKAQVQSTELANRAVKTMTSKVGSLGQEFQTGMGSFMDIKTRANYRSTANKEGTIMDAVAENSPMVFEDSTSGKAFDVLYEWGKEIGAGNFSVTHESTHKTANKIYAVKRVVRIDLNPDDAVALQDEISALQILKDCMQIVHLHDLFDEPDHTYLVLEKMRGGSLIERITLRHSYAETDARKVMRQLLFGVEYCHRKRIANRNLKPENILLMNHESDVKAKICDFENSKKCLYPNSLTTACGTEGYVAPEILEFKPAYDVQCDMWSLGVVLYLVLGGYRPFRGDSNEITKQIRYGEYKFNKKYWQHISDEAKYLITRMLTVNPALRITAALALNSDWMLMEEDSSDETSLDENVSEYDSELNDDSESTYTV